MPPLPEDVLRRVFDELDSDSLVFASHVSRTWRTAAHDHPTFSRSITFIYHKEVDPPPAAADYLFTRALATSGIIDLCFYMSKPSVFVKDVVLPLVGMCLHRVEDLRIVVHSSLSADLIKVLENPAPRLKWLRFDALESGASVLWKLSPKFLGGSAPLLDTIFTQGFTSVSESFNLPGLATTKKLVYEAPDVPGHSTILRTMLGLLPNLECLFLRSDEWPEKDVWVAYSAPLPRLELQDPTSVYFLAALSSPDTRHISVPFDGLGEDVFKLMLSSLAGALGLSFARSPGIDILWRLQLTDADGRARQLDFWEDDEFPLSLDITQLIPMFSPIAHRITRITVDVTYWKYVAELVRDLSSLETLDLSIPGPGSECGAISQVKWPRLKTIRISSPCRSPVNVLWLAKFMGHTLGCVARRKLTLHLKGCQLDGDPELVWGFFDEIKLLRA